MDWSIQRLWEENVKGLTLYVRQWVGNEAEDVVQESFIKLLQSVEPENPKAWLYRTARNTAIDRQRRLRWFKSVFVDNWFENLPDKSEPFDGEELTAALNKLPNEYREIIIAKIWSGLTFKEIAELVGKPLSTVHYAYQRGIEQLRKEIGTEPQA